jgi:hypothetical protein
MIKDGKEYLDEQDKHALEIVKLKLALAASNAEKALAQNDVAKFVYNNLLMQFTSKYNLDGRDGISEEGEILRNVASAVPEVKAETTNA